MTDGGRGHDQAQWPLELHEPFATSAQRGVPLVWASGEGDTLTALLGWGEAFRATARGTDRFGVLDDAFTAWVATLPPDANPIAFATVAFANDSWAESVLIVPALVGRWADGVLTVTPNAPGGRPHLPAAQDPAEFEELELLPGQLTRQRYRQAVSAAVVRIADGEVEKVVLARDLLASAPDPLDVSTLITRLQHANPTSYTFHVDGMVGASPEMLIATTGASVRSQVLAGSAPVTGDPETDAAAAAELAASAKDRVEHAYATESVVSRLRSLADVSADEPHIKRLPRIMHLATDVTGTLRTPRSALAIAGVVHPSAAVCGTPTEDAFALIAELEGFDRGRYAGPVGWVDARGDGEFVIALRCGQVTPDGTGIRLFAGGGIVAGSVPSDELAETARKFLPMYEALSPVDRP
ncbi:MAG: isochorismate synthase [Propionibacteriaceae bacterium]|nr:isochorismate synthase [Propionibacteriaceae bacterium]